VALSFPRAWPAIAALGAVVLIAMGTLVVDVLIEREVGERTTNLVDNAMRSIRIVDDLRYQAHLLTDPQPPHRLAAILADIAIDSRSYEPLTTYSGERGEWDHLRRLLERAERVNGAPLDSHLLAQIEHSVDDLVAINQREAQKSANGIRDINRAGIFTDLGLGILTILSAITIALMLRRSYRQQHDLMIVHLASVDERARELEAFSARVSHDLKGPLAPIVLASEVLLRNDQPAVKLAAERIRRSSARMTSIIDDLLSLSVSGRPPAGKAAVAPVVSEVLDEHKDELRNAAVAVSVADVVAACSHEVLAQLLGNLVGNASKYRSPERKLELHIDAHRAGDRVDVSVADNGVGMDCETREHAFEPFFRAPETRGTAGHGLGLAIVRRTVEALGGRCALDSTIGEGTRVTLSLPAA
jgi:two-component system, OmpR family, sensor kinase